MTTISPCESLLLLQELSWKFRNFHSIHLLSSSAAFSIFSSHSSHQPRRPSRLPTLFELSQKNSRKVEKRETLRANRSSRAELSTHKKKEESRGSGGERKKEWKKMELPRRRVWELFGFFLFDIFSSLPSLSSRSLCCASCFMYSAQHGEGVRSEKEDFLIEDLVFFSFSDVVCVCSNLQRVVRYREKNGDGMLEEANKVSAIKTR